MRRRTLTFSLVEGFNSQARFSGVDGCSKTVGLSGHVSRRALKGCLHYKSVAGGTLPGYKEKACDMITTMGADIPATDCDDGAELNQPIATVWMVTEKMLKSSS